MSPTTLLQSLIAQSNLLSQTQRRLLPLALLHPYVHNLPFVLSQIYWSMVVSARKPWGYRDLAIWRSAVLCHPWLGNIAGVNDRECPPDGRQTVRGLSVCLGLEPISFDANFPEEDQPDVNVAGHAYAANLLALQTTHIHGAWSSQPFARIVVWHQCATCLRCQRILADFAGVHPHRSPDLRSIFAAAPSVHGMASQILESQEWTALPILADALQDAAPQTLPVSFLAHLRKIPARHPCLIHACWAVNCLRVQTEAPDHE